MTVVLLPEGNLWPGLGVSDEPGEGKEFYSSGPDGTGKREERKENDFMTRDRSSCFRWERVSAICLLLHLLTRCELVGEHFMYLYDDPPYSPLLSSNRLGSSLFRRVVKT